MVITWQRLEGVLRVRHRADHRADRAPLDVEVEAEAPELRQGVPHVEVAEPVERLALLGTEHRGAELLHLGAAGGRMEGHGDHAVVAPRRRAALREEEVRRAGGDGLVEEGLEQGHRTPEHILPAIAPHPGTSATPPAPAPPGTRPDPRSPPVAHRLLCPLPHQQNKESIIMLWTIAVILMCLWVLGLVSSYTIGGFIHILLVLAVISIAFQLIRGPRTV
jgi:hypothetical protein